MWCHKPVISCIQIVYTKVMKKLGLTYIPSSFSRPTCKQLWSPIVIWEQNKKFQWRGFQTTIGKPKRKEYLRPITTSEIARWTNQNCRQLPVTSWERGRNSVYKVQLNLVLLFIGGKTGVRFFSQSPSAAITMVWLLSGAIWKLPKILWLKNKIKLKFFTLAGRKRRMSNQRENTITRSVQRPAFSLN